MKVIITIMLVSRVKELNEEVLFVSFKDVVVLDATVLVAKVFVEFPVNIKKGEYFYCFVNHYPLKLVTLYIYWVLPHDFLLQTKLRLPEHPSSPQPIIVPGKLKHATQG